jgi:hypothetical protein
MTIRAKFYCESVLLSKGMQQVTLRPVTNGVGNESWSKWTPSGQIAMTITNPSVIGAFVPGDEYYIDINPAKINVEEIS